MAAGNTTGDPDAGPLVHDAAGRVLAATGPLGLDSLGYSPDGTLRAVRRGGTTWRSRLDAAGHRVAVQGDTGLARVWVRVGATVLAELRAADGAAPSAWDVYLAPAGRAAAVGRHPHSGARRLYHRDALGSVRVETSGATVVAGRDYDPWGVELAGRTLGVLGAGGGPGFTGHPRDPASGLDLAWARALSPGLGRWTAPDPLRGDFPGWTPYHYADNDPLGRTDPTGLCPRKGAEGEYCFDLFIMSWLKPFPLAGDGRSFDSNAPAHRSRAQIIIDPTLRTVDASRVSESCFAGGFGCRPKREDNFVSLDSRDPDRLVLTFELTNSRIGGPDIDGTITFTRARRGWTTSGDVTAFPSNALYVRRGGRWISAKSHHQETTPVDLRDGGGRHKW